MSSLRFDPSQRPRPAGRTKRTVYEQRARPDDLAREDAYPVAGGERSFLSIVVPARNEAASLSQLVAEAVIALRALY